MARNRTDDMDSTAIEAPDLETVSADAPKHGFFVRLYTGTGAFEVIGRRKFWYAVSAVILLVAIGAILLRGFTFGIDFEGGTKVSFPRGTGDVTTSQVETVFNDTIGTPPDSVVIVGAGDSAT
ncbi:MAG TPA: protein translocase subunit SecF, partial [Mycobacterium sp.]|nr:protein translocase subunit SecF [Mycobacterium sp.]